MTDKQIDQIESVTDKHMRQVTYWQMNNPGCSIFFNQDASVTVTKNGYEAERFRSYLDLVKWVLRGGFEGK